MRRASRSVGGLTFAPDTLGMCSRQNQTHLKCLETKVKENLYNPAVRRQSGTRRRRGRGRGLALGGRVLAQEGGDGAGLGDLLGQRALHVFDGWVGAGVQQQLHDVGKLARRCCRKDTEEKQKGSV